MRRIFPILCVLSLGACAAPAAPTTRGTERIRGVAPASSGGLSVLLQSLGADGRGRQVLPSATLGTGDRVALWVEVDRPSYLYVAHQDAGGELSLLFPERGDRVVQPGRMLRVPDAGRSFEVTGPAGDESLIVLTSLQPAQPLRMLGPAAPLPPPPTVDYATRQAPDPILSARRGQDGVAVIRFPFRHR